LGASAAKPDTSLPPAPNLKDKAVKDPTLNDHPLKAINDKITGKTSKGEEVLATRAAKKGEVSTTAMGPTVAVLTIYSDPTFNSPINSGDGTIGNFGTHAWVMLTNLTSYNINMGWYTVANSGCIGPSKTVSFGTWWSGSTALEHNGMYYDAKEFSPSLSIHAVLSVGAPL
jgi:hypothetical protein